MRQISNVAYLVYAEAGNAVARASVLHRAKSGSRGYTPGLMVEGYTAEPLAREKIKAEDGKLSPLLRCEFILRETTCSSRRRRRSKASEGAGCWLTRDRAELKI